METDEDIRLSDEFLERYNKAKEERRLANEALGGVVPLRNIPNAPKMGLFAEDDPEVHESFRNDSRGEV